MSILHFTFGKFNINLSVAVHKLAKYLIEYHAIHGVYKFLSNEESELINLKELSNRLGVRHFDWYPSSQKNNVEKKYKTLKSGGNLKVVSKTNCGENVIENNENDSMTEEETKILTAQETLSRRKTIIAQKFEGFNHVRCCVVPAVYEDSAAILLDGLNNTVPVVLAFRFVFYL